MERRARARKHPRGGMTASLDPSNVTLGVFAWGIPSALDLQEPGTTTVALALSGAGPVTLMLLWTGVPALVAAGGIVLVRTQLDVGRPFPRADCDQDRHRVDRPVPRSRRRRPAVAGELGDGRVRGSLAVRGRTRYETSPRSVASCAIRSAKSRLSAASSRSSACAESAATRRSAKSRPSAFARRSRGGSRSSRPWPWYSSTSASSRGDEAVGAATMSLAALIRSSMGVSVHPAQSLARGTGAPNRAQSELGDVPSNDVGIHEPCASREP